MTAEISEADLLDTLSQSKLSYGLLLGHPDRADLIDNEFSNHEFKYELSRTRARQFPELVRDFADDLEEFLAAYGRTGNVWARLAQILASGAEEHINALIERLEYKERVSSYHGEKVQEAARVAVKEVARLQAGETQDPVGYVDPHGHYVYILWGDESPIYVGRSSNVLSRLGSHMADPERRAATKRTQLIRCADAVTTAATELALIQKYRPRFNINGNPDARR